MRLYVCIIVIPLICVIARVATRKTLSTKPIPSTSGANAKHSSSLSTSLRCIDSVIRNHEFTASVIIESQYHHLAGSTLPTVKGRRCLAQCEHSFRSFFLSWVCLNHPPPPLFSAFSNQEGRVMLLDSSLEPSLRNPLSTRERHSRYLLNTPRLWPILHTNADLMDIS